jgi:hypothetical protein
MKTAMAIGFSPVSVSAPESVSVIIANSPS